MRSLIYSVLLIFAGFFTQSLSTKAIGLNNKFNILILSKPFSISTVSNEQKLIDIYKKLDGNILKSKDEKMVRAYLIEINKKVAEYLRTHYLHLGSTDFFDVEDVDFAIFGLVYGLAEYGGYMESTTLSKEIPAWLQCVGGILGITAIYELVRDAATATYANVWSIVKKLVKRYVGWIGVGIALWEISTECF